MKKVLMFLLIAFLIPAGLFAADKDVVVTNTVPVDVVSLPDNSLELGTGFRLALLFCRVSTGSHICAEITNPSTTSEKLIHWATLSLLADPGFTCRATLSIADDTGSGSAIRRVLRVYATDISPGEATIALPRPIRIEDVDELSLTAVELNSQQDGCRADASVGVELVTP